MRGTINADDLKIDGRQCHEVDGRKLHALCLTHMSQFMVRPTAEQALLVAALLEALSRHQDRFDTACNCNPYLQARAVWLRVVEHIETSGGEARAGAGTVH